MTDGTTTWTYTYDANGMRTQRSNGTKTYNYVYNCSQLMQMTVGNDTLYFTYGVLGPTTVTWNGETYYYALNGQGDVIGIYDEAGKLVVLYNWDNAWGYNPIPEGSLASTLGTLNPLRYRSYVYDNETGYYYLQSRYYDPEIGRFINADVVFDYDAGLQGFNLYIYCGNNPVNRIDISGADSSPIDDDVEDILEAKTLDGGGNPSPMPGPSAVVTNPIDAGYRYSVDLSQALNSSSFSGGILSNGYSLTSYYSNPSNNTTNGNVSSNGVAMYTDDALDAAIDFLGTGYTEMSPPGSGRFVSSDGFRQVRIGYKDITGAHAGAPHMNFEYIDRTPHFKYHVYLLD